MSASCLLLAGTSLQSVRGVPSCQAGLCGQPWGGPWPLADRSAGAGGGSASVPAERYQGLTIART